MAVVNVCPSTTTNADGTFACAKLAGHGGPHASEWDRAHATFTWCEWYDDLNLPASDDG